MTELSHLPLCYRMEAVERGLRKPRFYAVQETAPVSIAVIDPADVEMRVDMLGTECLVVERRFWMPVYDDRKNPIRSAKELSAYSDAAVGSWSPQEGFHPVDVRWDDFHEQTRMALPSDTSLGAKFQKIGWSDRDEALAALDVAASRLAFVDGVLHTDRFEPVYDQGVDWNILPRYFVDVIRNEHWTCYGSHANFRYDKETNLLTPPVRGPLAGQVDWQYEPWAAFACYLVDRRCSTLSLRQTDMEIKSFRSAVGPHLLAEFDKAEHVRSCMMLGYPTIYGREDLDRLLQAFEVVPTIDNPRFAHEVSQSMKDVVKVQAAYDAYASVRDVVAGIDDDAIEALAYGGR